MGTLWVEVPMTRLALACLITLCALPCLAFSQEDEAAPPATGPSDGDTPRVVYDSRTELDMDGADVRGENTKPLGETVVGRRAQDWRPLYSPKPDFDAEMLRSVRQVR